MKFRNLLVIVVVLLSSSRIYAEDFSKMVIFGDSLSDTGNLASVFPGGDFGPPFYMGSRISNGPVAVEHLAEALGFADAAPSLHLLGNSGGSNYSVAGARAGGSETIDLNTQVAAFFGTNGGLAPDDALYLIFIGGNDVRDARDVKQQEAGAIIDDAIEAIDTNLRALISAGAQHIMVVNSADIGALPETAYLAELEGDHNNQRARRGTKRSLEFNEQLIDTVAAVEKDTYIPIALFDLFGMFNQLVGNSAAQGYINDQDACLNLETGLYHPDCSPTQFDEFVMFDLLHPSGHSHFRASRSLEAMAPRPLPTSLP